MNSADMIICQSDFYQIFSYAVSGQTNHQHLKQIVDNLVS